MFTTPGCLLSSTQDWALRVEADGHFLSGLLFPVRRETMTDIDDFDDTSTFENKAGLAEDMRFLASIPEVQLIIWDHQMCVWGGEWLNAPPCQYQKVRQRADQKFSLKNLMDYQLWLAKGSFLGNENGRANKKDTSVKIFLCTMYPHNLVFQLTDITFLVGDTREPVCAVRAVLAARFLAMIITWVVESALSPLSAIFSALSAYFTNFRQKCRISTCFDERESPAHCRGFRALLDSIWFIALRELHSYTL